jgi:hypothetical protein
MKLVIQTSLDVNSPLDDPEVFKQLTAYHATNIQPSLEVNEKKFHYFNIDEDQDVDALIEILMNQQIIQAAYTKHEEMPPSF